MVNPLYNFFNSLLAVFVALPRPITTFIIVAVLLFLIAAVVTIIFK